MHLEKIKTPADLRALEGAQLEELCGEMREFMRAMVAGGMSPDAVAEQVVDAVRDNRFWILTHPESPDAVLARAQEIVNGINPGPAQIV